MKAFTWYSISLISYLIRLISYLLFVEKPFNSKTLSDLQVDPQTQIPKYQIMFDLMQFEKCVWPQN